MLSPIPRAAFLWFGEIVISHEISVYPSKHFFVRTQHETAIHQGSISSSVRRMGCLVPAELRTGSRVLFSCYKNSCGTVVAVPCIESECQRLSELMALSPRSIALAGPWDYQS
jgi:hypothetical protein